MRHYNSKFSANHTRFHIAAIPTIHSDRNMKIGFVLYDYYPFGGLQEDCLATALATERLGHEIHIFTRTWKGEPPARGKAHILGKTGWSNTSRNQNFFKQLSATLPQHNLDGIVAFNRIPQADIYFAADPCFLERKKATLFWQKLGSRHRYYAALEASIFKAVPALETLVLTEREIDAFTKHYPISKAHFHLLPPGVSRVEQSVSMKLRNRANLRSEFGTSEATTVALFVGSGFRIKGLDRALKAVRANQSSNTKFEFWIVGNGNPTRFKKLAQKAGVPVRFIGGRADVASFYDAADFLLHPAYSESAGKVLLEAITHGLPVLTTDTCGYEYHIRNANAGHVLPSPFSQDQLNDALKQFIEDTKIRKRWSAAALEYAANQDLYSCHEFAAKLIEEILTEKSMKH